ncbi:ABC transporter ATP-binding protein [Paenibacillus lautus]|jgi:NitT/TauT family transport system ATP-binding protein|uniref:ABC transporter ATP-binding protein n=1 Tax=Paenibacillus lautus TaxID=1401 RepID=A0A385TNI4_PAELA|nr:ABC transporter ATP-binding protein [Paenibacillus lautus]AYB45041.1 ABC transporter ATP-binding protein [Paenibacillus lautus]MBY0163860.1 ABC transporter ATP-binding protein [Cytobacillus firmus]MCI1777254.1 ABC transporter ATP-binding protein [Paenibacillus lautus]VTR62066.1 ABC-type sulfate/molybdate transport systems, ATPase component [Actinobacillus pleuropneumoniae]
MVPVVELNDIAHVYVTDREASLAVEGIHLKVEPGEFISLVGPSGCGKTTILSVIAGLLAPSKGSAYVNGKPVNGPSPEVGYMLQQDYLFPWRTIMDNALIGLELTERLNPESRSVVGNLLREMGLGESGNLYPAQLSGGMRQRVALVRTLATDPGLLLLDEPFSALDYQTKLQLEDLIVETLKERGKTAILVTHDLSEAIAMSDRVILLNRNPGRVHRLFDIPDNIRRAQPFFARKEPGFNELFHEIWGEMQTIGKE